MQKEKPMAISPRLTWMLSLAAAAAVGVAGTWLLAPRLSPAAPPPIVSLEKMGDLVAVKLNYSDVFEFTQKRTLDIPWSQWELRLGGTKVLLVARGDCTVATNLGSARYEQVNGEERRLTVVLPSPRPLQARINHAPREKGGSFFYAVTSEGIEPFVPDSRNRTQAINNALALVQKNIERACGETHVIATAKQSTEDVLRAAFSATGWTPAFVWK
ncbi:MAG TPA: DUF4230 domain-containing protein [Noviherbaspirillum sp.]|uniref:DUF4230 domain-containing protein n=1 Tax=Noviherbaspirillum sp. TaxID=1926288 RepID=UPI002F932C61